MYCNQCGKGNYDEYDSEEYYEEKEVKFTEKKGEERKDFDKKEFDKKECFRPCHKPEPICHEWEEDYVCKFTSKCYPKKPCKPCCSCCNKR